MMKKTDVRPDDFREIHLIPYMHCDFSWTNSRKWHIWRYISGYKKVLEIMREDPDFTYVLDNVAHSWLPFKKYCPELVDEFRQRVREGRIVIANGGYALERPDYNGYEGFVRNVLAGKRYFEKEFEIPEEENAFYFNADTAIGNSQLPQILAKFGYRYYRSNRPSMTMNEKGIPRQFRWRSPDGSEVLVARGDYGGLFVTDYFDKYPDMSRDWENIRDGFWAIESPQAYNTVSDKLMLFFGCDDVIPGCNLIDKPVPYREFLAEWNKREKSSFFLSTPGRYFAALDKEDLPTVEGVLDNCELSFVSIQKGEQALFRKTRLIERALLKLEYLSSMLSLYGVRSDAPEIGELWTMLFDISGHAIEWALREDIKPLEEEADEALLRALRRIREAEETLALSIGCENDPDNGVTRYVAVNPYPEDRTEYVAVHITTPHGLNGLTITDTKGNVLPYQATEVFTADKAYQCQCNSANVIVPVTLPACGWETLTARTTSGKVEYVREELDDFTFRPDNAADPVTVDNGVMEITFDKGAITRISSGGKAAEGRFGQLLFVESDPKSWCWIAFWKGPEYGFEPETWGFVKNGPLMWQYKVKGTIRKAKAEILISIFRDSPRIEYSVTLDCEENEGFFSVAFPCDGDSGLWADIPYGVEKRDMEKEPSFYKQPDLNDWFFWESAWRGQFYALNFALFERNGLLTSVISDDCGIFYSMRPDLERVSLVLTRQLDIGDKSDAKDASWIKLCSENHKTCGKHTFRFAYYLPGAQDENEALKRVQHETKRYHFAPDAVNKFGFLPQGDLPLTGSAIRRSGADCIVTALYEEDGRTILRGYESTGVGGEISFRLNSPVRSAVKTDLAGRPVGAVQINGSGFTFAISPYEIFTVALETES